MAVEAWVRVRADTAEAQAALRRLQEELTQVTGQPVQLNFQDIAEGGGGLGRLVQGLRDMGLAIFGIQQAYGAALAMAQQFYGTTLALNDQMERNLIATKGLLVATTDVFRDGFKITDPAEAMEALEAPLKEVLDKLRVEGSALVTPFTQQSEVFQIVAGQLANIGGNLEQAKDLTLAFAASLDALGLPAFQARQEITSLLSGMADQHSLLAQRLFGSTQQANELVRQWKLQGTLVENLLERMSALREAARQATQTISGISSNIGDLLEQISMRTFEPLMAPAKAFLNALYEGLESLRDSQFLRDLGAGLQVIIEKTQLFAQGLAQALGPSLRRLFDEIGRLILNVVDLFGQEKDTALEWGQAMGAYLSLTVEAVRLLVQGINALINAVREGGIVELFRAIYDNARASVRALAQWWELLKPLAAYIGNQVREQFERLLWIIQKTVEGWAKIFNLIRLVGQAVGAIPQEETAATTPAPAASTAPANTAEIRGRVLSEEAYHTPERLAAAWQRAMADVRRNYAESMDAIALAQAQTETAILESTDHTTQSQRQAAVERAQIALENAEKRLQIERQFLAQMEELYQKKKEMVAFYEEQIAQLLADGITEQEATQLDQLYQRLEKEKQAEEQARKAISDSRKKMEQEEQNMIKERQKLEEEARKAALEGIEMQKQALRAALDLTIKNLQAQEQEIRQQQQAIQSQINILQEALRGLQLDQQFAEKEGKLTPEAKQEYLKKEYELRDRIFKLEQQRMQLEARRQELEARRAVLAAQKQLVEAQADLQAAQMKGERAVIQQAQHRLQMAQEEMELAQDQLAFARENLRTQTDLARIKEANYLREKRNAFASQGLTEEARRLNRHLQALPEMINTFTAGLGQAQQLMGQMGFAANNIVASMGRLAGQVRQVNQGLTGMNKLLQANHALGHADMLKQLRGPATGTTLPKGAFSARLGDLPGARGGIKEGNLPGLGRSGGGSFAVRLGDLPAARGNYIANVNITFNEASRATLTGAKSVLRGNF